VLVSEAEARHEVRVSRSVQLLELHATVLDLGKERDPAVVQNHHGGVEAAVQRQSLV
jgi:hypothetical protein